MQHHQSVEGRIQRFLREHHRGPLKVLTGYVSYWGLAWLQTEAPDRPVTIVVGDLRPYRFGFGASTAEQRRLATQFLNRQDTELKNWYTKKSGQKRAENIMHAKAWITEGRKPAVLLGSANLTQQGLRNNFELIAKVDRQEQRDILSYANNVIEKAYPADNRVIGYLNEQTRPRSKTTQQKTRKPSRPRERRREAQTAAEMQTESNDPFGHLDGELQKRRQRSRGGIGW